MKPVDYSLYIDDSGTKEYAASPSDYGRTGNSRYFAFGAILISTTDAGILASSIKANKSAIFGTEDVEIKSNWLRIPKERQKRYIEKHRVDEESLEMFVHAIYQCISQSKLRLFVALVDKVEVQEKYDSPWYAPAIAYEILMQRVALEVRPPDRVRVIIDDMTGATPKGNQYRANLLGHHERLRKYGSQLQKKIKFDAVQPGIKFVDSAKSHLIQMADIIAYNVYRQFVEYGEFWETGIEDTTGRLHLPAYKWFERIGEKFCHDGKGRIQGYGVVKFPMGNRIKWGVDLEGAEP